MPTLNDSNVPYGSVVCTIGGVAFVAENLTITEPSTVIEVRDQLGAPSDATLQFAATSTVPPTIGASFTYTPNGGTLATYYLSEVGQPITQLDIKKVNIGFRKALN
jgi:hypothetical protein